MKTKKPLLSFRGDSSKNISRKIIILFTILIISLSSIFLPYQISSFDKNISYEDLSLKEEDEFNTEEVIKKYVEKLEKKGYKNISIKLNLDTFDVNIFSLKTEKEREKSLLSSFNYYAEYVRISKDKKTFYYFKNTKDRDNFIKKINKYTKVKFKKYKKVRKEIGFETDKKVLNEEISKAKLIKKQKDAQRRKIIVSKRVTTQKRIVKTKKTKVKKKNNYYVKDTKGISNAAIVRYAIQFVGNPYVHGGTSLTRGTDCSGFTQSIYKHFGKKLPRTVAAQAKKGKPVSFNNLQPGDLVFYSNGRVRMAHVAIYIGGGKIVHAGTPRTGINICTVNIMIKVCARRIL